MIPEPDDIENGWSTNEPSSPPPNLFILKSSAVFLSICHFLIPSVVKFIALSSPSIVVEPVNSIEPVNL